MRTTLMSLFSNVPVEDDTTILSQRNIKIDNLDALYQKWFWEGVKAESLIFIASDVDALNDSALESLAKQSKLPTNDSSFTFKRNSNGFTFINFNFTIPY